VHNTAEWSAQVGNFRVEPPGLFRGRGEHPKMGRIKRRIYPKDIVINIGKGVPVPKHPFPDQHWKMVRRPTQTRIQPVPCFQQTHQCDQVHERVAEAHSIAEPAHSHCRLQTGNLPSAPAGPARQQRDMAGVLARPRHPVELQVRVAGRQQQFQVRERPGRCRTNACAVCRMPWNAQVLQRARSTNSCAQQMLLYLT
jgi:Eukaryotic DNA topoisomerase I, DNA binding fragment